MMITMFKKISMKDLWTDELKFTSWLCENIDYLNEELGLDIEIIKNNKKSGSYSTGILAKDKNEAEVVIENQFSQTDHDHLGKLLTYASSHDARTAIWIAEDVKDDHKKAILWLNEFMDRTNFYAIKCEVLKNRQLGALPRFSIISGPRKESGTVKMFEKGRKEIENNESH